MSCLREHENTAAVRLGDLLQGLAGLEDLAPELARSRVTGVAVDSRRVVPGGLFLAIPGIESDGRQYVAAAVAAGADAVLYESRDAPPGCAALSADGRAAGVAGLRGLVGPIASRFFGDPSTRLSVTGVTGTNGKTTCAWLLAQAMELLGERCAVMGTVGNGFPEDLVPAALTTADAVSLQQSLKHWLDAGAAAVCMEVSSHGLHQERVNGIRFHSAVFTNLTRDHLDYHGDMASYAAAKKQLFHMPGLEMAVVNRDDPVGRELMAEIRTPRVISYGVDGGDVSATGAEFDDRGIRFRWHWQGQTFTSQSGLIGEINLANLLAVIAALLGRGREPEAISQVLPRLQPPPGRMERLSTPATAPTVIVDYSHTPDSLERALRSLRPLTRGALGVVFGCGGDRDVGKRPLMGRVAALHADRIIITNDNPRSEDPASIAAMAQAGVEQVGALDRCRIELDRAAAIEAAIRDAGVGDVILIAGKGHESSQTIDGEVLPFNDRSVAAGVVEGLH